jgi:hypothetical protein
MNNRKIHQRLQGLALCMALALLLFCITGHAETRFPPCDGQQAFGVKLGDSIRQYKHWAGRSQYPQKEVAAFAIKVPAPIDDVEVFIADTDAETGKIFSVTAYRRIVPDVTSGEDWKQRVPALILPVAREVEADSDIEFDPKYFNMYHAIGNYEYKDDTKDIVVAFNNNLNGLNKSYIQFSCTGTPLKRAVQNKMLRNFKKENGIP